MDGRGKVMNAEGFPWNQVDPTVQMLMDLSGCDKVLAEKCLEGAFFDPDRAYQYVTDAMYAPVTPACAPTL